MKIKSVNPLGEVEDLELGRVVAAGEVVEVTQKVGRERIRTGNYEAVDEPAEGDAEKGGE